MLHSAHPTHTTHKFLPEAVPKFIHLIPPPRSVNDLVFNSIPPQKSVNTITHNSHSILNSGFWTFTIKFPFLILSQHSKISQIPSFSSLGFSLIWCFSSQSCHIWIWSYDEGFMKEWHQCTMLISIFIRY